MSTNITMKDLAGLLDATFEAELTTGETLSRQLKKLMRLAGYDEHLESIEMAGGENPVLSIEAQDRKIQDDFCCVKSGDELVTKGEPEWLQSCCASCCRFYYELLHASLILRRPLMMVWAQWTKPDYLLRTLHVLTEEMQLRWENKNRAGRLADRAFRQISGQMPRSTDPVASDVFALAEAAKGNALRYREDFEKARLFLNAHDARGAVSYAQSVDFVNCHQGTVLVQAFVLAYSASLLYDLASTQAALDDITLSIAAFNWVDPHEAAVQRFFLGMIQRDCDVDPAEYCFIIEEASLRIDRRRLNESPVFDMNRAIALAESGQTVRSRQVLGQITPTPLSRIRGRKLEGFILQVEGRHSDAIPLYQDCASAYTQQGQASDGAATHLYLADAYLEIGDLLSAKNEMRTAAALFESISLKTRALAAANGALSIELIHTIIREVGGMRRPTGVAV